MELKSVILLFLFLCLLGHLECTDQKQLKVKRGEDATLECSGPTNATLVMIRWEKSEDIVILFRDGRFQEKLQHELFKGRVSMKDPKWKETGDFSVILKHVTTDDAGTYECKAAYDGQKPQSLSRVTLKVENSEQKELKVKRGEDATLECSGPTNATLVMIRWEKSEDFVILFRDGQFEEKLQHELFKGRVSMKDPKWKETGELSVILKHVTTDDAGTYECKAAYDGQKPQSLSRVTLKVENSDVSYQKELTVKGGADATLECSGPTDASLVTMRWEKSDLQSEDIVILFRDGQFQENLQHELFKGRVSMKDPKWKETGDFSVILKHVTTDDGGTYECQTAYDGQKPQSLSRVTLKVENSAQTGGQSGDGGKEDEGEKRGSAGLIAGLIVLLVILVAAVASFLIYRKHKMQNQDTYQPPVEKHYI